MALKAKISYFKVVFADQGISYDHLYRSKKETRIITIPVGYGDGYPRSLSNAVCVAIRGTRFPIAGRICMDQFMVDIGDRESYVGDVVTLIGDEIPLQEFAQIAGTDPRDITCRFTERIPRLYI
jgi:alanine racemase